MTDRLTQAARRRLLDQERRERNRVEENALEARLTETQALGENRGAEYEREGQKRGEARKPIRRLSGLYWLHKKGRIDADQLAAGVRYGAAYRRAGGEGRIRSILDREVHTGSERTIADLVEHSEAVANAKLKLAMYRRMLSNQPGMVRACDRICGEELTPREASINGKTAEGVEAVLRVALDLLIQHLAPAKAVEPQDVEKAA